MAWIESHQNLDKNGKVLELANQLKINKYQAIGHLHALWWWAIDNAEDGNIARFSYATVTQACGWQHYIADEKYLSRINEITNADMGATFIPALIACGFLDQDSEGLWIHNWHQYTARYYKTVKSLKRLREDAKIRMRRLRKRDADVTPPLRDVTVPTLPYQTLPIKNTPTRIATKTTAPVGNSFEAIWTRYPRKLGRKTAERHFRASVKTPQDYLDLQNALGCFIRQMQKENRSNDKIPYGSTWFFNWRDWVNYEEAKHGADGSQGVSRYADIAEQAREIRRTQGLRKIPASAGGSLLAGIRDRQVDPPDEPDHENREPVGE